MQTYLFVYLNLSIILGNKAEVFAPIPLQLQARRRVLLV